MVIFSVSATMTRYVSVLIVFPFIVVTIIDFFKHKNNLKHIPLLILIMVILLFPHYLVRNFNYNLFLSHPALQNWSIGNFFKSDFTTTEGLFHYPYINLLYAFSHILHPRYLFTGIMFLPFLFLNQLAFKNRGIIFLSILIYALFLAGIPYQNNRFLLLTFPLVLICFFPAFNYISDIKPLKSNFHFVVGFIIIAQTVLVTKAFKPILERNHFELKIAELLKPYQYQKLYSFDIDIALKGRNLKFDYKNLWEKRYTNFKEGDLVLFHPTKFEKQWNNKNPMLNWSYLNSNYQLKTILNCPNGWKLYRIVFDN